MAALAYTAGDFSKCLELIAAEPTAPGNDRLEGLALCRLGKVIQSVERFDAYLFTHPDDDEIRRERKFAATQLSHMAAVRYNDEKPSNLIIIN
jgi:hypothetical protein